MKKKWLVLQKKNNRFKNLSFIDTSFVGGGFAASGVGEGKFALLPIYRVDFRLGFQFFCEFFGHCVRPSLDAIDPGLKIFSIRPLILLSNTYLLEWPYSLWRTLFPSRYTIPVSYTHLTLPTKA